MNRSAVRSLGSLLQLADVGTWGEAPLGGRENLVLRSSNIVGNALDLTEIARRTIPSRHLQSKRLGDGDILVVTSSGSHDHIGKCCLFAHDSNDTPCYFSNFTLRLRPDPALVDPRWVFYWLSSNRGRSVLQGMNPTTSGLRNLNKRLYLAQSIPVKSIAEQRRIVTMLDRADAIRRKRHQSLAGSEKLLQLGFLKMFGDPIGNERGWSLRPVASVIRKLEAGTSVKGDGKPQGPSNWAVLKISAVTAGWYLPNERKTVAAPPARPIVPTRGDLLFSRANTRELVAATCLVDQTIERLFLPDKLWRITPNTDLVTAEYLRFLFSDNSFRHTLTRHATGTSGSMLNVSQEKVLGMHMPVPPLALQQQFASLVWKAFGLRERINEAIRHTNSLFESMVDQAFKS